MADPVKGNVVFDTPDPRPAAIRNVDSEKYIIDIEIPKGKVPVYDQQEIFKGADKMNPNLGVVKKSVTAVPFIGAKITKDNREAIVNLYETLGKEIEKAPAIGDKVTKEDRDAILEFNKAVPEHNKLRYRRIAVDTKDGPLILTSGEGEDGRPGKFEVIRGLPKGTVVDKDTGAAIKPADLAKMTKDQKEATTTTLKEDQKDYIRLTGAKTIGLVENATLVIEGTKAKKPEKDPRKNPQEAALYHLAPTATNGAMQQMITKRDGTLVTMISYIVPKGMKVETKTPTQLKEFESPGQKMEQERKEKEMMEKGMKGEEGEKGEKDPNGRMSKLVNPQDFPDIIGQEAPDVLAQTGGGKGKPRQI